MERHHELTLGPGGRQRLIVRQGDRVTLEITTSGAVRIVQQRGSGNRYRIEVAGSAVDAPALTTSE